MHDKKASNRSIGKQYETFAAAYLKKKGIRIITHNFRVRGGEIDLVGMDENQLVFVEVKYRKDDKQGNPAEAVGHQKQCRICRAAEVYLAYYAGEKKERSCRYDVVSICGKEIVWYKNAFEHKTSYRKF